MNFYDGDKHWIAYEDGTLENFNTWEKWVDELFRLGITNPGPEGYCVGENGVLSWGTDRLESETVLNKVIALEEAGREVIRAANRDPDDGPTGWCEAMSVLSNLVFPLDD